MGDPIDLDELERLARAATPGPWQVEPDPRDDSLCHIGDPNGGLVTADIGRADAAYLAALSPDRVLALIERVRRVERSAEVSAGEIAELARLNRERWDRRHGGL